MRTETIGDLFRLLNAQFLDLTAVRPTADKGTCDMKVNMRNRLIGGDAVVLPYGDARTPLSRVDRAGDCDDLLHDF